MASGKNMYFYLFYFILFYFILFFGSTGGGTQGLMLSRQVRYHLNHAFSPFCFSSFGDTVSPYAWASLPFSQVAGMTDMNQYPPTG
jgi:hypothetical protein